VASKAPIPVKTADGLLKALLILSRTVDHALELDAVKAATNERLSGSKMQILRLLGTRGSQTSSQVARFLGVSKPAVTQLIDGMVRRKLVGRRTATHDRREVDLRLTEKGKQVFQAVRSEQRNVLRSSVRQVTGGNPTRWLKTLEEVTDALVRAGDCFDDYCLQCGAHPDESCVLPGGGEQCVFLCAEKASAESRRSVASGGPRRPRAASTNSRGR
jgi:DNA-binding MarR family transcriptional regulator